MANTEDLDWLVPRSEWERTCEHVIEEWGELDVHLGHFVVSAMREHIDNDGGTETEELVDRLVRAAGRRPRDLSKNKMTVDPFGSEDKTRAHAAVHTPTKGAFHSWTRDNSDNYPGVELAYALRAYREGGRYKRLESKLDRVVDDAAELLSEIGGGPTLGTKEKRTISIVRHLSEKFAWTAGSPISRADIHEAIEDVTGSDSEYMREQYTDRVVDRLDYEPHPQNPEQLFVPTEDAEEQRRKEAEAEAEREMRKLDQGSLSPDGAGAMTDGGRD